MTKCRMQMIFCVFRMPWTMSSQSMIFEKWGGKWGETTHQEKLHWFSYHFKPKIVLHRCVLVSVSPHFSPHYFWVIFLKNMRLYLYNAPKMNSELLVDKAVTLFKVGREKSRFFATNSIFHGHFRGENRDFERKIHRQHSKSSLIIKLNRINLVFGCSETWDCFFHELSHEKNGGKNGGKLPYM